MISSNKLCTYLSRYDLVNYAGLFKQNRWGSAGASKCFVLRGGQHSAECLEIGPMVLTTLLHYGPLRNYIDRDVAIGRCPIDPLAEKECLEKVLAYPAIW